MIEPNQQSKLGLSKTQLLGESAGLAATCGMAVMFIGWFQVCGSADDSQRFALATVANRVCVPFLVAFLIFFHKADQAFLMPFAVLDPILAIIEINLLTDYNEEKLMKGSKSPKVNFYSESMQTGISPIDMEKNRKKD